MAKSLYQQRCPVQIQRMATRSCEVTVVSNLDETLTCIQPPVGECVIYHNTEKLPFTLLDQFINKAAELFFAAYKEYYDGGSAEDGTEPSEEAVTLRDFREDLIE